MHAEYGRRGDLPGHQPRSTALSRTDAPDCGSFVDVPCPVLSTLLSWWAIDGTPVNWAHGDQAETIPHAIRMGFSAPKGQRGGLLPPAGSVPGYSNSSSAGALVRSFRQRSSGTWAGLVDLRKSSRTAKNRSASRHGRKCPAPSRISSRAPGMASAAR